jgi:P27 family predicted phage terminase small subunit
MGKRGPIANPERVRLHGTERRRLKKSVPSAASDAPEPPEWLSAEQRALWRSAVRDAPAGVLLRIDRGLLTVWVVAADIHRQASRMLAADPDLLADGGKVDRPSPYLTIARQQSALMLRCADQLGFSPSGRARLHTGGPAPMPAAPDDDDEDHISLQEYLDSRPPPPRIN